MEDKDLMEKSGIYEYEKVSVVDENDIGQMTMTFATIDINASYVYFNLL